MEDIDKEINGAMSTRVEQLLQNKSEGSYQRHNSLELPSLDFDEIGSIHDKIQETGKTPTKSTKETTNLYLAYKHIKDELKKSIDDMAEANTPNKEIDFFSGKHDSKGFIEVESLIKHTHNILMEDIMHEGTPPGNFSTYPRTAEFNGKTHEYPKFENVAVAEQAIQTLVDKVNEIIESIRQKNISDEERAKMYFKCSSLFLFCFLSLHPFGDGNGRLARLLSSYNLLTFSPFLTPIYNVFSATRKCDYVQALVDARQGLGEAQHITVKDEAINMSISAMEQKPSDLCSMLIESNWTVWRQLLFKLGDKTIKLYKWEIENQNL
ncbi:uncharacterized protein LOC132745226 [Ruditapes philippinarum]|uniref:uncharacterized protein LOC132745226 n=1 Tax=Ruditapes philippinarum TaxID=129788 RepID=UPI00295C0231|nr:uncharacterized protein LOC132745226 [Ruditapes philippinarum]